MIKTGVKSAISDDEAASGPPNIDPRTSVGPQAIVWAFLEKPVELDGDIVYCLVNERMWLKFRASFL